MKSEEIKTEELVAFELDENIYSYLLFLLSLEEKDFKEIVPRHQIKQVLFISVITLALQFFILTVMV